jgi:PAS domain S-box-containing protein
MESAPVSGDLPPLKVLLVDDIQENIELLEEILQENGYHTVPARNGVEALTRMHGESVHIIVADAMMPKMDGFQLCKEVRAVHAYATIPFIIYTGNYVDSSDQEFARSIGVDRYVVKYAGLGALVQAINELAQQRYGRRPAGEPEPVQEHIDDQSFLEKHRAIVIKKLEEKMAELEMYAETLIRKNREIQASEDRYRTLFDHASIPIFVLERGTGKVVEVNKQGLDLLGYTREELLGMSGLPFDSGSDFAATKLHTPNFSSSETEIDTKSGRRLNVDVGVGPLTRPQDTRVLLYVRDITEQKRMRDQLVQAEKMSVLGRLAAGIAHEIRNPLSAISLNLQYLVQKFRDNPELCESLKDALEGAKRVEVVMENTLNLARVSPPVLKNEDLNHLAEQVLGFIKISVQQKVVRFDTTLADNLPPVCVDAKQIQQVLLNVVQNAIDASPEPAVIHLSTEVDRGTPGNGSPLPEVIVSVRDHGPGLTTEQRQHLFEQFYTTKEGGTGLGLAISKQIMDRHKGEIRFGSAEDHGTIVQLVFPINS